MARGMYTGPYTRSEPTLIRLSASFKHTNAPTSPTDRAPVGHRWMAAVSGPGTVRSRSCKGLFVREENDSGRGVSQQEVAQRVGPSDPVL